MAKFEINFEASESNFTEGEGIKWGKGQEAINQRINAFAGGKLIATIEIGYKVISSGGMGSGGAYPTTEDFLRVDDRYFRNIGSAKDYILNRVAGKEKQKQRQCECTEEEWFTCLRKDPGIHHKCPRCGAIHIVKNSSGPCEKCSPGVFSSF